MIAIVNDHDKHRLPRAIPQIQRWQKLEVLLITSLFYNSAKKFKEMYTLSHLYWGMTCTFRAMHECQQICINISHPICESHQIWWHTTTINVTGWDDKNIDLLHGIPRLKIGTWENNFRRISFKTTKFPIGRKYLLNMKLPESHTIEIPIHKIFEILFQNYSKVTRKDMLAHKTYRLQLWYDNLTCYNLQHGRW